MYIVIGLCGMSAALMVVIVAALYCKYRAAPCSKDRTFHSYVEYTDLWFAAKVCAIVTALTLFISCAVIYYDMNEHNRAYERLQLVRPWYESLLTLSEDDVARDEAYRQICEYNNEIAETQSKYNDWRYALNFSSKYNWNDLELIVVDPNTEVKEMA